MSVDYADPRCRHKIVQNIKITENWSLQPQATHSTHQQANTGHASRDRSCWLQTIANVSPTVRQHRGYKTNITSLTRRSNLAVMVRVSYMLRPGSVIYSHPCITRNNIYCFRQPYMPICLYTYMPIRLSMDPAECKGCCQFLWTFDEEKDAWRDLKRDTLEGKWPEIDRVLSCYCLDKLNVCACAGYVYHMHFTLQKADDRERVLGLESSRQRPIIYWVCVDPMSCPRHSPCTHESWLLLLCRGLRVSVIKVSQIHTCSTKCITNNTAS